VLELWEFAEKCMHYLGTRGLAPGASVETMILRGCEVQFWFWDILTSSCWGKWILRKLSRGCDILSLGNQITTTLATSVLPVSSEQNS